MKVKLYLIKSEYSDVQLISDQETQIAGFETVGVFDGEIDFEPVDLEKTREAAKEKRRIDLKKTIDLATEALEKL